MADDDRRLAASLIAEPSVVAVSLRGGGGVDVSVSDFGAFAVRLGFVFVAIGLPSLFATIIKNVIGRARPFVAGNDIWAYQPLTWHARYASFPSGHATTAFAALLAIGVCNWFAARRLGFAVSSDGSVHAMPGPSVRRIIKAVARRLHSA